MKRFVVTSCCLLALLTTSALWADEAVPAPAPTEGAPAPAPAPAPGGDSEPDCN